MRLSMYVLYTSDSESDARVARGRRGVRAWLAHLAGAPVQVEEEGVATVWIWDAKFEACASVGAMQHSTRARASESLAMVRTGTRARDAVRSFVRSCASL